MRPVWTSFFKVFMLEYADTCIFTHTFMSILTSRGHQTDDNRGGGWWALNQHCNQDPHHQSCHRVGQHRIVLENIPCHLPWLNMPHTHQCCRLRHDTAALSNVKQDTKCLFPQIQKVSGWSSAVNYTAEPRQDTVNCSVVTHLFNKHQLAESPSTHWGGTEG